MYIPLSISFLIRKDMYINDFVRLYLYKIITELFKFEYYLTLKTVLDEHVIFNNLDCANM